MTFKVVRGYIYIFPTIGGLFQIIRGYVSKYWGNGTKYLDFGGCISPSPGIHSHGDRKQMQCNW